MIISDLFVKYELRHAPPVLSFWSLPKKKERAAPERQKKLTPLRFRQA